MAKVKRESLPRGAELLPEHVFDPLSDMAAEIAAPNITDVQMEAGNGTFRLSLSVPHISARFFRSSPGGLFYIPFCLPPLQEHWVSGLSSQTEAPHPVLTDVAFSFDQRGEPAHLADRWAGYDLSANTPESIFASNPNEGDTNYGRAAGVDIRLSVLEKPQHAFIPQHLGGGSGSLYDPAPSAEREVWAVTIGGAQLSNRVLRENPVVFSGLSEQLSPKSTYIVALNADGLYDSSGGNEHLALIGVQIVLGFKMALVPRDRQSIATVQNMPTVHGGEQVGEPVLIVPPPSGSTVSADDDQGVSTNVEKIDAVLRHKLAGGYGDFSSTYVAQHVKTDAAYDIIAVPMFGNAALGEILARPSWLHLRSATDTSYTDRRLIPLTAPMTIHHVIATNNFTTATLYDGALGLRAVPPAGMRIEVGVAVAGGGLADSQRNQQVAYGTYLPLFGAPPVTVDFMDLRNDAGRIHSATPGDFFAPRWEQSLFAVPIVEDPADRGLGYVDQGRPFFVGPAASGGLDTQFRSNVGTGAGSGAPNSGGEDAYLEVRMQIVATNGDVFSGGVWQANYGEWDIFSGYGGCWVYIIGKKHMRT
ncbi:hypothetical protein [uncultured Mediterranean phage]|nr:hypothetical protein [uncultured Mediterranean phage]